TGGRSTRMGVDKASLPVDGVPMGERVVRALRAAGATSVVAVGGAGLEGLPFVADDGDGGPMAGVRAALAAATADVVVILACDLPDVNAGGIQAVVAALVAAPDALVAVPIVAGRVEPLHAAWRRAALAAIPAGERAVHRVIAALPTAEVSGLDAAWLRNVNEPGDLRP
ncbi:MAG: NTP transferase domain-containing protein, partial [Acidobacteria bacterium]|nr:NTP transferase domain-containing protein [Acidobacteriota bacterium]